MGMKLDLVVIYRDIISWFSLPFRAAKNVENLVNLTVCYLLKTGLTLAYHDIISSFILQKKRDIVRQFDVFYPV